MEEKDFELGELHRKLNQLNKEKDLAVTQLQRDLNKALEQRGELQNELSQLKHSQTALERKNLDYLEEIRNKEKLLLSVERERDEARREKDAYLKREMDREASITRTFQVDMKNCKMFFYAHKSQ